MVPQPGGFLCANSTLLSLHSPDEFTIHTDTADGRNTSMGDEMVATGGIALLCDNLLQPGQPEASKLQAVQTIATLSASPVNAVAIAEAAGTVDGAGRFQSSNASLRRPHARTPHSRTPIRVPLTHVPPYALPLTHVPLFALPLTRVLLMRVPVCRLTRPVVCHISSVTRPPATAPQSC